MDQSHLVVERCSKNFTLKMLTVACCTQHVMFVRVCVDGLGAEGSEWLAEEGEGRLEQVDSGTESADDRYANIST